MGTKHHFHVNSSRKNSTVLTTNMAALSRGCKPRINCYLQSFSPYHFLRQRFVSCCISSLLLFSPFSFYDVCFVKKKNKTKTSLVCMKDSNSRKRSELKDKCLKEKQGKWMPIPDRCKDSNKPNRCVNNQRSIY